MCSSCRMDAADVKRMRMRQGAVPVEDFDDEPRYRHPKRRKKKPRSKTRAVPCPETEDGKHVYVWAPYETVWSPTDKAFRNYFGYARREIKTCCGCLATTGLGRETEQYIKVKERKWRKLTGGEFGVKRGEPVSAYRRWRGNFYSFTWEDDHEGYQKFLVEWYETAEGIRLRKEKEYYRIQQRRKWLGY